MIPSPTATPVAASAATHICVHSNAGTTKLVAAADELVEEPLLDDEPLPELAAEG